MTDEICSDRIGAPDTQCLGLFLRTPRPAPVAGERTAPTPRHVLHAGTGPRFVEAGRIERSAVPVEHRPVLLARRIEDRLQKIHEAVRPADTLRRTAPGPTHEDRTFHVRIAAATSMPTFRQNLQFDTVRRRATRRNSSILRFARRNVRGVCHRAVIGSIQTPDHDWPSMRSCRSASGPTARSRWPTGSARRRSTCDRSSIAWRRS